ncbi:GNAT family N-acetyltransferase [Synechococcus sp. ATX 2A4]|uniref:GNAT family N-acyltransferase n=1 Tax=Synechococcus sp. ATX 2A4 TaxID=2823727 RepID=UPI0020CF4175|nr:GNAT family N-acyltransferase [Synechococcus sp. ATX 2A4]MCP9884373.1 GNAT family N-acetyltransferase [Synechococcus sp. ATX 2A4]
MQLSSPMGRESAKVYTILDIGLTRAMGEEIRDLISDELYLSSSLLYRQAPFAVLFIPPSGFDRFASEIGRLRAISYKVLSPATLDDVDLDGRDSNYWQLLVIDEATAQVAGGARISFSAFHGASWDGTNSYLEHCYPGIDRALNSQGNGYVELGRTFVSPNYQRTSNTLLHIMRATVMAATDTSHRFIIGMVSYNHFQFSPSANALFISELLSPAFKGNLVVPPPRHCCPFNTTAEERALLAAWDTIPAAASNEKTRFPPEAEAENATLETTSIERLASLSSTTYAELELKLRSCVQDEFRIPIIMKRYARMAGAKPIGLSVAKDFNQITEILMYCDLHELSPLQRRKLLDHDRHRGWLNQLPSPYTPSPKP